VTDLEIEVITEADFNIPIDVMEFRIPFQAGTVFADHRNDREQFAPATKTWKATVNGADALEAADHPDKYRASAARPSASDDVAPRRWRWVIAANVFATALIYLGIRVRRRAAWKA
jgi:hypothetical protein